MGRRAIVVAVCVVVVIAGVGAIFAVLSARDDATVSDASGPGVARPADARPAVAPGNVLLLYSDERLTRRLEDLAKEIGGPPDPQLVDAGQAVLVRRRTGLRVAVVAVTSSHRLDAGGPDDPALRSFIEFWLGREPAR